MSHHNSLFSKNGNTFNYDLKNGMIGGHFVCSNLSCGYHGILQQYWEFYHNKNEKIDVLLVSENNKVKNDFLKIYPNWNIFTIDLHYDLTDDVPDIVGDLCSNENPIRNQKFDLIINQATLEHTYNPFKVMENLVNSLKNEGTIVSHTHPPGFQYHSYPRDYFRFMIDWWFDIPNYIENIELMELCMLESRHVFSVYKRI
jgi:SAM-dependent methyltransferase